MHTEQVTALNIRVRPHSLMFRRVGDGGASKIFKLPLDHMGMRKEFYCDDIAYSQSRSTKIVVWGIYY